MKLNKPLSALYLAVLILILATILVLSAYSDASSTETTSPGCLVYQRDRCPTDHLETLAPPETTSTSTSTTIDFSFLNTTTTVPTTTRPSTTTTASTLPLEPTEVSDRWDVLAQCESGGRWDYPPVAGGFSGGLMFHVGTWRAMGGEEFAPDAYLATREQQIEIAERTRAAAGGSMSPWPGCSRRYGWL